MVEEGEFKKRIRELWNNTETPNKAYTAIEVHSLKRVLLGEIELMVDEAKKEFPNIIEDYGPLGVRYIVDTDKVQEWFVKWFGSKE